MVIFDYYLRKRMQGLNWFQFAWKPVAITVVMVGVMWVGNQINLVVALIAGVLVYAAGLAILKVIGPDERRALGLHPAVVHCRSPETDNPMIDAQLTGKSGSIPPHPFVVTDGNFDGRCSPAIGWA
ncbi:MAG: hypothetical protein R3C44_07070 [Chloroflexota bacterium]